MIVYHYLSKFFVIEKIILENTDSKLKQFTKRIKRYGFFNALGQAAFMLFIFPFLKFFSQKRRNAILSEHGLQLKHLPEDKIIRVNSLSSDTARTLLKELQPGLLIVNGTRIISRKTLESVTAPFINIHTGITPAFRGVHGGYWAIAKGKKEKFGATIHYVDAGVDTGGIIEQVHIEPGKNDNFYTYPYLQYAAVLPVLKKVVQCFDEGNRPPVKHSMNNESSLWFHPTIIQWIANLKRTLVIIPSFPVITLF
jgi:folate-dependent phosphoribosylglycinamide formyltransferase PurN